MAIGTAALLNLIIIVAIGIIAGVVFSHYGRSWLGRKVGGVTSAGNVTYALVGVAGAFIGFHLAVVLGLAPAPLIPYLAAAACAAATIWLWRGR